MRGLRFALLLVVAGACGDEQPEAPSFSVRVATECEGAQLKGFVHGWMLPLDGEKKWSAKELREWGSYDMALGPNPVLRWEGQKPGQFLVGFSYRVFARAEHILTQVVDWDGGAEPCNVELPEPVAPRWLSVRALDPAGAVLTDVWWTTRQKTRGFKYLSSMPGLRRSDGVTQLYLGDPGTFGSGRYTVEARALNWGTRAVEFFPGSSDVVDVVFVEQVSTPGRVENYVGSGYEGRVVVAVEGPDFDESEARSSASMVDVASDGRFQLLAEQPGECVLNLYVRFGKEEFDRIATERVLLRSNGETIGIRMPKLYRIRVTSDARFTGWINLSAGWNGSRIGRRGRASPDSRSVVFDALPAGSYHIEWGDQFLPDISIPEVSELALPKSRSDGKWDDGGMQWDDR